MNGYRVFTDTFLDVECTQKGQSDDVLTIRTLGGLLPDGRGMFVSHEPSFSPDERVRVFLRPGGANGTWEVVGAAGKQSGSNAGGTAPYKANECGYGAFCMGYNEWLYSAMPIGFYINANTPDVTGEETSVRAGMVDWENDAGSIVSFTYLGLTSYDQVFCDGVNLVRWQNQGPGALATAHIYCFNRNGITRQTQQLDFDIVFNDYHLWGRNCEQGRFDIQTVAEHESGHAIGLEHVREQDEIMKPGFSSGECLRDLGPGDTKGVQKTYPGGGENLLWILETDWPPNGAGNVSYNWWNAGDTLMGDWDGDGDDTPGVKIYEFWSLRNSNSNGAANYDFAWGQANDVAVVGDWDNDGDDTLGVVRGNTWYIKNSLTGSTDFTFGFGQPDDIPIVGDWDCDGWDEPGLVRGHSWYLSNEVVPDPPGTHDILFPFGSMGGVSNDIPVVGDWDGDGCDEPGVLRGNTWYLSYEAPPDPPGIHDISFGYGSSGDIPLSGHWTGAGERSYPGVLRHAG